MNALAYFYSLKYELKPAKEKQRIGQQIVKALNGVPGKVGPDGGLDGYFQDSNGVKFAFQVKLSKHTIARDVVSAFKVNALGKGAIAGVFVSINGLSSGAKQFLHSADYAKSGLFQIADITISDILLNFHHAKLSDVGLHDAIALSGNLQRAVSARS